MKLYIDIDDVIVETTRTLAETARAHYGKNIDFENMTSFDLQRSLKLGPDEFEEFMSEVHEPAYLRELEPVENAKETLIRWHDSGARLELVTGRPPHTRESTTGWLEDHSIPYDRLEFVDKYGRHKKEGLPRLEDLAGRSYDLAIEDSSRVATYLAENTASRVLLFDRPWNRDTKTDHGSMTRVFGWKEIWQEGHA